MVKEYSIKQESHLMDISDIIKWKGKDHSNLIMAKPIKASGHPIKKKAMEFIDGQIIVSIKVVILKVKEMEKE